MPATRHQLIPRQPGVRISGPCSVKVNRQRQRAKGRLAHGRARAILLRAVVLNSKASAIVSASRAKLSCPPARATPASSVSASWAMSQAANKGIVWWHSAHRRRQPRSHIEDAPRPQVAQWRSKNSFLRPQPSHFFACVLMVAGEPAIPAHARCFHQSDHPSR